jgi:hypothetical protein
MYGVCRIQDLTSHVRILNNKKQCNGEKCIILAYTFAPNSYFLIWFKVTSWHLVGMNRVVIVKIVALIEKPPPLQLHLDYKT